MGQLLYGSKVEAEIDDRSLFHLDVLLLRLKGVPFQLHFMPGGKHDGQLVSISISPGSHLVLVYGNFNDLELDGGVVEHAELLVRQGHFVSIPFVFKGSVPG